MRARLLRVGTLLVVAVVVVAACSGGSNNQAASRYETVLADGTVTDGEYEQAWRLVEECLRQKGIESTLRLRDGEWGVTVIGEFADADYQSCSEIGDRVAAAYFRERVPDGAERLELADSLRRCLSDAGVTEMPFTADTVRANEILASAIEQLGFAGGEEELLEDPRFRQVLDCLGRHELLFPARFEIEG